MSHSSDFLSSGTYWNLWKHDNWKPMNLVYSPSDFVVFLLCFSSSCVPYVAYVSQVSPSLIAPSVFSNVYWQFLWFLFFWLSLRFSLTLIFYILWIACLMIYSGSYENNSSPPSLQFFFIQCRNRIHY